MNSKKPPSPWDEGQILRGATHILAEATWLDTDIKKRPDALYRLPEVTEEDSGQAYKARIPPFGWQLPEPFTQRCPPTFHPRRLALEPALRYLFRSSLGDHLLLWPTLRVARRPVKPPGKSNPKLADQEHNPPRRNSAPMALDSVQASASAKMRGLHAAEAAAVDPDDGLGFLDSACHGHQLLRTWSRPGC